MSQPEKENQSSPKTLKDLPAGLLPKADSGNFIITGVALVALSAVILLSVFYPLMRAEFSYLFSKNKNIKVVGKSEAMVPVGGPEKFEIVRPANENFGIVIPKINANAEVIADVDSQNPAVYQKKLAEGVAHALGTKYPGEEGNVFLFAHSGQDFLEANRYNAVFYLLSKLEAGDEIFIFYKGKKYRYEVLEKKTAAPEEIGYIENTPGKNTLTLMTCWPGGTTWKRLVVRAEQK
jgi:sortase A